MNCIYCKERVCVMLVCLLSYFIAKKWSKVIHFSYSKSKDVFSRMCLVKKLGCMINKTKHIKWITKLDENNDGVGKGVKNILFRFPSKTMPLIVE